MDYRPCSNSHGIVITTLATQNTLAHEIGHALKMSDIYVTNESQKDETDPLLELLPRDRASFEHMVLDWNGGCLGCGEGGARYYVAGTSMREIVGRMLMLGDVGEVDARRDISAGDVYGVCYTNGVSQTKVWIKSDALVAYPWSSAPPVHL